MPLQRRLPKRGFHNPFRVEYLVVNLADLEARFEAGSVIDVDALRAQNLVKGPKAPVKLLANGTVSKALTVRVNKFSEAAKKALEAAGGTAEVI